MAPPIEPRGVRLVDFHCHFHEFGLGEAEELLASNPHLLVVAVSDDLESSLDTLWLASRFPGRVVACVGLHPWEVGRRGDPVAEARRIVKLALEHGVACLGEVGLDTKFVAETIEVQRRVFRVFLEAAAEHDLLMNLHTAGTWEEVYKLLREYGVRRAVFHWYTGPLTLIPEIQGAGYLISINPAILIQRKHQLAAAAADPRRVVFESDGPYEYRGLRLEPSLIPRAAATAASILGLDPYALLEEATRRAEEALGLKGDWGHVPPSR